MHYWIQWAWISKPESGLVMNWTLNLGPSLACWAHWTVPNLSYKTQSQADSGQSWIH